MMHFLDPAADGEFLAELREAGLVTPDVIEQVDARLGRPEMGTLNEFLLAGADSIPEKPWLTWLIRRHGCHRFGRVEWPEDSASWARAEPPEDGNLPYRQCRDRSLLLAVLRPDLLAARPPPWSGTCHRAAATLAEIRSLQAAWRRAIAGGEEAGDEPRSSDVG
jgi:hypothetical protein